MKGDGSLSIQISGRQPEVNHSEFLKWSILRDGLHVPMSHVESTRILTARLGR